LPGYLDEPVGIDVGPDGQIYVADTWNQRIQVFDRDGVFLREWPIAGWDTGLSDDKPYLAVDDNAHVYVTDPGHYRVLVFDREGEYILSFGQYGSDERSFTLPMGIDVGPDGRVYVTDAHSGRVMVFAPLILGAPSGERDAGEDDPTATSPALKWPVSGENVLAGSVMLLGIGEPGGQVRVLVNGEEAGVAGVDADGVWRLAATLDEPGTYRVVLQSLDTRGAVGRASGPIPLSVVARQAP
jgi:DNA-binding beta-propeller fold protein YncE